MWRCPKCETINNNENYCYVCGEQRPAATSAEGSDVPPYPPYQTAEQKKSKALTVALIIATCVLVIVAGITAAVFLLGGKAEPVAETTTTVAEPVQEIYYVNTFDDSGIYVREDASKKSGKVLYIKKGDTSVKLKYLGDDVSGSDGYLWHHVETPDGVSGYVREDVVKRYYQ